MPLAEAGTGARADAAGSTAIPADSGDPRVAQALLEYLALRQKGEEPARSAFLERHASIADSLEACLDGLTWIRHVGDEFGPGSKEVGAFSLPESTTLGEFRLIRELGRGGMGIVYEAEQVPLGRRVALKVLPEMASLDPRQRQRFQVEAQAAALLHHEHIVPIYAIGLDRGVHYYAMQLIEGMTLTDLIRGRRAERPECRPAPDDLAEIEESRSRSAEPLGVPRSSGQTSSARARAREAAQMALQAAEAIDHAHELGVIHRDIKPSNLLLDPKGKLWVADFGLARLPKEENDLTETGDLVGTLRYMSPEQVRAERGGVTAATDIYSLGVTLYELLTLRPAFEARDRQELLRSILHDEPTPIRKLNGSVPRDLETIVQKAMEKDPPARYGTARALADDLRRFLDDQPIRARRPGLLDRGVKWARRHRTAAVAATSALIVTLATTSVVLWDAKGRTESAFADLQEANRRAESTLTELREANRRTESTLADLRKALNLQRDGAEQAMFAFDQVGRTLVPDAGKRAPPGEEAVRILESALYYYNQVPRLFEKRGEAVARAHRQAGFCRVALGRPGGFDDYRAAVEIYEQLAAEHPDWIWLRTGLIATLHESSCLHQARGNEAEADAALRQALEVAESLIGNPQAGLRCFADALVEAFDDVARELLRRPSGPDAAARAARLSRQATAWIPDRAKLWSTLGLASCRQGDWPGAVEALGRAVDLNQGDNTTDVLLLASARRHVGETESSPHETSSPQGATRMSR